MAGREDCGCHSLLLTAAGVVGAQLSGAGLGGCIMVLVHRDSVDSLHRLLAERFYEPKGLEPALTVSAPVKALRPPNGIGQSDQIR
jgi:galactokinase